MRIKDFLKYNKAFTSLIIQKSSKSIINNLLYKIQLIQYKIGSVNTVFTELKK